MRASSMKVSNWGATGVGDRGWPGVGYRGWTGVGPKCKITSAERIANAMMEKQRRSDDARAGCKDKTPFFGVEV